MKLPANHWPEKGEPKKGMQPLNHLKVMFRSPLSDLKVTVCAFLFSGSPFSGPVNGGAKGEDATLASAARHREASQHMPAICICLLGLSGLVLGLLAGPERLFGSARRGTELIIV